MANTQYPEGKPFIQGGIRFSNQFSDFESAIRPTRKPEFQTQSQVFKSEIRNPEFRNSFHISKRDINSARRFTPNLTKIFRRWNFTVCSVTSNRAPISALVSPSAQHKATCASRRLKFLSSTTL